MLLHFHINAVSDNNHKATSLWSSVWIVLCLKDSKLLLCQDKNGNKIRQDIEMKIHPKLKACMKYANIFAWTKLMWLDLRKPGCHAQL